MFSLIQVLVITLSFSEANASQQYCIPITQTSPYILARFCDASDFNEHNSLSLNQYGCASEGQYDQNGASVLPQVSIRVRQGDRPLPTCTPEESVYSPMS